MVNSRSLSFVAISVILFMNASPSISFQHLTKSTHFSYPTIFCVKSASMLRLFQPLSSLFELRSSQTDNEDNSENDDDERSLDPGGVLGSIASTVVLCSEFVLKTTGCGLPAGPFGIVGAVEGVSYLGVVATCAAAAVDYFSDDGLEGSDRITRRLATALGLTAAVVGIAVLAFQVTDYGYIPNAVPMEGGMCK